ncbi:MAG TPA: ATP-binding protein [Gemmataceae bacterium]|nr:ATP-binding protein [Gemmataceae bacterium]
MSLGLRFRLLLTLLPIWALVAGVGTAGLLLLLQLGGRIGVILHENYDSVLYMERLHEALERIDSSFQFALAGRLEKARRQYDAQWPIYEEYLAKEQGNITLRGEKERVDRLAALTREYRKHGDAFYGLDDPKARSAAYFGDEPGDGGLLRVFESIKATASEVMRLNQDNMEHASADAKSTATRSVWWFGGGLLLAAALAALLGWQALRTLLEPIRGLRRAAQGIAAGNLDQVLPAASGDELGELSQAFNTMARNLRELQQSQVSRLLRAQRTSQATIDSFPDPVLVVDAIGNVEMANPAARTLLGIGVGGAVPWTPPDSLRRPLSDALQGQKNYLPEGFDHILRMGSNGEDRALLPRILTIRHPNGDLLGAAVLLQDVTGLRILDEMKSNLVAIVSHELKTPLTSLRLAVHLLLEEACGPLTPKQTELLLDARENSERLLRIVENLLNLARFEQGRRQLDFEPHDPAELLRTAADVVRSRAHDKGIDLVVDAVGGLPSVAVDPMRLQTALNNLLDNAIEHTDRGGRVTLEAAAHDGSVLLTISDNGHGIPADALPHVFEKFFRVQGRSRRDGTGLGLAIVHEIVVAHGGTIECISPPGEGTTFRLTLPAEARP